MFVRAENEESYAGAVGAVTLRSNTVVGFRWLADYTSSELCHITNTIPNLK